MSHIAHFLVHPVTLTEATTATNQYGDSVPDWSAPPAAEHQEVGWFTRTSTDEMNEGREAITDSYELTLPPTSAIKSSMRVSYLGDLYEIRGSVERCEAPKGTHHLVARLRRVEG